MCPGSSHSPSSQGHISEFFIWSVPKREDCWTWSLMRHLINSCFSWEQFYFIFYLLYMCLQHECVCVHAWAPTTTYTWRSKDNFLKSVLSSHHAVCCKQSPGDGLAQPTLCPLSHHWPRMTLQRSLSYSHQYCEPDEELFCFLWHYLGYSCLERVWMVGYKLHPQIESSMDQRETLAIIQGENRPQSLRRKRLSREALDRQRLLAAFAPTER